MGSSVVLLKNNSIVPFRAFQPYFLYRRVQSYQLSLVTFACDGFTPSSPTICTALPWIQGWSKSPLLNRRNQFSTVWTVEVWLPYAFPSKRWHPAADFFEWKQESIASRLKIVCCSHLCGMTNTFKTSSRVVLWCKVGCNLFRCQNILSSTQYKFL